MRNYYNDNSPAKPLTFGSLFAGIGGFDLGFERAGMQCKWQVEIDPNRRATLERHWPGIRRWDDVRTFPPAEGDWGVDVICGGFPCQDISVASSTGDGLDGERSGLWREFYRAVCAIRPRYVAIENSPALVIRGLESILRDFAAIGFDAEWQPIRASDFAMPHRRERLAIVAYPHIQHGEARVGSVKNRPQEIFGQHLRQRDGIWVQAADPIIGMDDGIRGRSYRIRAEGIGNSLSPKVAEWIGHRIVEASERT